MDDDDSSFEKLNSTIKKIKPSTTEDENNPRETIIDLFIPSAQEYLLEDGQYQYNTKDNESYLQFFSF